MRSGRLRLATEAGVVGLMAAALTMVGCIWLAVGAAGGGLAAVWYEGKVEQTLNADIETCHRAAERALADLKLPVLKSRADAVTAHLESEYADRKHVWINLEAVGTGITKVTIRVGLVGDQNRSVSLLEGIKRHAGL